MILVLSKDDIGRVKVFNLKYKNKTAIDLTGKTATLRYTTYPTAGSVVTRSLAVQSPASDGRAAWTIQAADTATPGVYIGNIRTEGTGFQETLPPYQFLFKVVSVV